MTALKRGVWELLFGKLKVYIRRFKTKINFKIFSELVGFGAFSSAIINALAR
jgi:hypothetical protein